ncbi:hypothetical protein FOZ62_000069 [Perkinsus olseni]|uniref:Uncharacterized protein n=1 Tax=Perkinsus olseni TaxID=32597 RepID=A0A7J6P6R3_PEROL|nr:hypothetical protein FOZ62_000069 [Perkinsus olseni]
MSSSSHSSPTRKRPRVGSGSELPGPPDECANPAPSDERLQTAGGVILRVIRGRRGTTTVATVVVSACSETAKIPSRPTQLKNVHVHDGGVVATVDKIPNAVDWLSIKKALDEKLGDLPSPVEGNAVTFATKVDPHSRSCFVLFKPFDVDEEVFRHMTFKVNANSATSSPNCKVASSSQAELEDSTSLWHRPARSSEETSGTRSPETRVPR